MKVKTIKIRSISEGLEDFTTAFRRTAAGRHVRTKTGTFFSGIEAVRRILTNERIKLLKHIKTRKPKSIYELAKGMEKNIKNVAQDLRFLTEIGLVEMHDSDSPRHSKRPVLLSDHILLELVI